MVTPDTLACSGPKAGQISVNLLYPATGLMGSARRTAPGLHALETAEPEYQMVINQFYGSWRAINRRIAMTQDP
jgi:hypothetical protein